MPQGEAKTKPISSPQKKFTGVGLNKNNSVANGIAIALNSSGEKQNERRTTSETERQLLR